MADQQEYQTVDAFDRQLGQLTGLPDSNHTKATTIVISNMVETATYIVQTYRVRDKGESTVSRLNSQIIGDTIFVQRVDKEGADRLALPPRVAEAIARQRDALTDKSRSAAAKTVAAERKAAGIQPAFLKTKKRKKR